MNARGSGRTTRRSGDRTREEILAVALDLFITKGYEGTSVRDIAEALGITPAALYYHFRNKEEIATGFLDQRRDELDDLVDWIKHQPPAPGLAEKAALRWIDHATPEHLQGLRFAHANQPFLRRLGSRADSIPAGFDRVVEALAGPRADVADRLWLRMILDTLSAAIRAGDAVGASDEDILWAARRAASALVRQRTSGSTRARRPAKPKS